ncbi:MAG: hypothetical protein JNK30_21925, partial [Phenylobacterium sp.]|uniref:hypothetical protein n=1 Tax=Phenylobacterium sp. TaxID=1871053 RepID=UPI001A503E1D
MAEALTPERMDAALARVLDACVEGVELARGLMAHAAEGQDIEGFERCGRTANAFARTVGQVVLLKQRFDREQAEA